MAFAPNSLDLIHKNRSFNAEFRVSGFEFQVVGKPET